MLSNPGPGKLIVLEGLDGSGTTTQIHLLGQRLGRLQPAYLTHEPSDGPLGLQIRMVLEHLVRVDPATLAALFAADRADHLYHDDGGGGIVARLRSGTHVVTDRYYLSSFAYQGMNLDWGWLWDLHAHCIRPDLTLFLDVSPEVCVRRIAAGRGERYDLFENLPTLTRVRENYLAAIERLRAAGEAISVIDGNASPEGVEAVVWEHVSRLF